MVMVVLRVMAGEIHLPLFAEPKHGPNAPEQPGLLFSSLVFPVDGCIEGRLADASPDVTETLRFHLGFCWRVEQPVLFGT